MIFESQSAQDAQSMNYGGESYWRYLEETALRYRDMYLARGDAEQANLMMTRTLTEALRGNDGI